MVRIPTEITPIDNKIQRCKDDKDAKNAQCKMSYHYTTHVSTVEHKNTQSETSAEDAQYRNQNKI